MMRSLYLACLRRLARFTHWLDLAIFLRLPEDDPIFDDPVDQAGHDERMERQREALVAMAAKRRQAPRRNGHGSGL